MVGMFCKNSLTGNNNFLSVGKLQLCPVLNPTGLVSGPSKPLWCFSAWEEVLPPAVLGQCPPCLFTYLVTLKPGLTVLSCLIIFVVFLPWKSSLRSPLIIKEYTIFKNITVLKIWKAWSLIKEKGKKPRSTFSHVFCALNFWISLNGNTDDLSYILMNITSSLNSCCDEIQKLGWLSAMHESVCT